MVVSMTNVFPYGSIKELFHDYLFVVCKYLLFLAISTIPL